MPTYNPQWTTSYEALPPDSELVQQGASRIRDLKYQIRVRMQADHSWNGDGNDGYHLQATLIGRTADPSIGALSTAGILYSKLVGGHAELFYKDDVGNITQVTQAGQLAGLPTGSIAPYAGSSAPGGWLICGGQAVSRSSYAGLFSVIGTTYGIGDGSSTFNVPDLRGRAPIGVGQGSGLSNRTLAQSGGEESHVLSVGELALHSHTITDPGHNHSFSNTLRGGNSSSPVTGSNFAAGSTWGYDAITMSPASTGITGTASQGSNTAHNTMQPFLALNFIIKT